MAKRGNDSFTPSGWNGPDPNPRKSNCYADSDPVGQPDSRFDQFISGQNEYDYTPWSGDGSREGRNHSDVDANSGYSKNFLDSVNLIDSRDPDYAGSASGAKPERNSVDVSRADRGRES